MQRMGQHFLTSYAIAKKIADTADISHDDSILEIGPGKGMLTDAMLEKNPKKIIAVEKDSALAQFLTTKYAHEKRIEIIDGDILKILPTLHCKLQTTHYKLVSNIPYYLTSFLIRLLLHSNTPLPRSITLMVQKEVAERIVAKPPHMNLLALSVQSMGNAHIAYRVSRNYFAPKPKVDSAVIHIENISEKFFNKLKKSLRNKISAETREKFFESLRYGFGSKRKMLLGNLSRKTKKSKNGLEKIFAHCAINPRARAENLSLEQWKCLLKKLTNHKHQITNK